MGWVVIRFWGKEIKKNLMACVKEIKETIYEIQNDIYQEIYNAEDVLIVAENEANYDIENNNINNEK
jgi:hypothetical protein